MIEALSDQSDIAASSPKLAGIETDFKRFGVNGLMGMTFELRQHVDRAIFQVLCEDLAQQVEGPDDEQQAFHLIVHRLARWQRLLARERPRILTPEEVRGLFGELIVFSDLLALHPSDEALIIESWDGPSDAAQDFRFSQACLEVKATTPDRHGLVRISSEDQLHRLDRDIYLVTIKLRDGKDDPTALSLNELAAAVSAKLTAAALSSFEEKLAQAGYMSLEVYNAPRFLSGIPEIYRLQSDAPVLHRGSIPAGVSNLRYDLDTSLLAAHRVTDLPEIH